MKVTVFDLDGDAVGTRVTGEPPWQPFEEWEGQPVTGVRYVQVLGVSRADVQQMHIKAGGHIVMHTTPDLAVCQIVSGRGTLALPDGTRITYDGPELYVFEPNTLHEWTDVEVDTLLTVCLVHRPNET